MPGADVSMLPPMKCHPGVRARRWTADGVRAEHSCGVYQSKADGSQQAILSVSAVEERTEVQVEDAGSEVGSSIEVVVEAGAEPRFETRLDGKGSEPKRSRRSRKGGR